MPNIIFTKGGDDFTFTRGRSYPVDDPVEVSVVTELSEGMQMYAYDKGVAVQYFNLSFEKLAGADYDNVDDWLQSVVVGPKETFTYTDEDSVAHTVRMLNTANPLKEVSHDSYAGTIRLREEI